MNITNRLNSPTSTFWDEIDSFFNSAWAPSQRTPDANRFLVHETDEGWTLRTDLPGYRKEDVEVSVDNGYLKVVATETDELSSFVGGFEQRLRLSPKIDASKVSARLEHGVLAIVLPRKEVTENPDRRIEIN